MASKVFMCPLLFLAILVSGAACRPVDHGPRQASRVKEALWAADYKIMSLVVSKKLAAINEACRSSHEGHDKPHLTIFVPHDDAILFNPHANLEYQIVTRKVERDDFASGSLETGSKLGTCFRGGNVTVTRSSVEDDIVHGSVNRVPVTNWNIYNDGNLTVHGVMDFFDVRWTIMDVDYRYVCRNWNICREEAKRTKQPRVLVNDLCPMEWRPRIDKEYEGEYELKRCHRDMTSEWLKTLKHRA